MTHLNNPAKNIRHIPIRPRSFFDELNGITYRFGRVLGEGGCGFVDEVISSKGERFALKTFKMWKVKQKEADDEVKALKKVTENPHSRIMTYVCTFKSPFSTCIVFELCSDKNLRHLLRARRTLDEDEVRFFRRQLTDGLSYLHGLCLAHCDLKPDNVLFTSNLDFAEDLGAEKFSECLGTDGYMAPEVVRNKKHTFALDVWSLGIIFYEMMVGRNPVLTTKDKVFDKKDPFKHDGNEVKLPPGAKSLLSKMLRIVAARRLTVKEVQLYHFLESGDCPKKLTWSIFDRPPTVPDRYETAPDQHKERRHEDSHRAKDHKRRHEDSGRAKDRKDHKKTRGERREDGKSKEERKDDRRDHHHHHHHKHNEKSSGRHGKESDLRAYRRKWKRCLKERKKDKEKLKAKYGKDVDLAIYSSELHGDLGRDE
ncbi:Serine/threonine-protein kinase plk1 [Mortierella sp. GBA35]|nr:Serine/threonine-protein kinase plk1 [Mortierella sp. GBA35]